MEFDKILISSIAPVTLISGVGLLLLSMTNRYGRVIDRVRSLSGQLTGISEAHGEGSAAGRTTVQEVRILWRRAVLLRSSIVLAAANIFFVALMIASLFASRLLQWNLDLFSIAAFSMSLICLVVSLALFIKDITLSLEALKIETRKHGIDPAFPLS